MSAMLARFDRDVHNTHFGHGVRDAQLHTWEAIHRQWRPHEPALPLTWPQIRAVGAHMEEAIYRSWGNYASRIKEEHVMAGHAWSLLLETSFRKAKRSVLRGVGPGVQAVSLDLELVVELDVDDLLNTPAMPLNLIDVFVVHSFFMLREVEASFLKWRHVVIDRGVGTLTLALPISKSDPQAHGCRRSWGCVCPVVSSSSSVGSPCAFHSFLRHHAALESLGPAWISLDAPLFPDAQGRHCSKIGVIQGYRALGAAIAAKPLKGQGEIGGHTARVTGARYLAALGIELAIIQLMARHASACIMDYVRDAPLLSITGVTRAKRAARLEHDTSVVQSWRESRLQAQLDRMAERIASLQVDHEHFKGLRLGPELIVHEDAREDEDDADGDALVVVINVENDKAHIAKVAPASGTPPAEWRARCPWHFGFAPHRVTTPACVAADAQLWSERCRRCWHGVPIAHSHDEVSTSGSD